MSTRTHQCGEHRTASDMRTLWTRLREWLTREPFQLDSDLDRYGK